MRKKQSDRGSAPLETAALLALLLVPVTPMLNLFSNAFDAIAAESIARHALRYSMLWSTEGELRLTLSRSISLLSESWGRDASFEISCGACSKGSLVTLEVVVGNSRAIQVAGMEPR